MLEILTERGGREPLHTAVCCRDGGREGGERTSAHSCMLERWRERDRGREGGEIEGERGEREPVHTAECWRDGGREGGEKLYVGEMEGERG